MSIFSEELRIMDANSLHFIPEHIQEEIDYLKKEIYQITLEKEQAVKEAEQAVREAEQTAKKQEHRINVFVFNMFRDMAPEDFSAKKYAELLSLDPSVIEQVYEKIHSDPAPDEAEILALLNQNN